jgi:hypothetical protein
MRGSEIAETIRLTLETTSPDATHWSLRSMAAAVGTRPRPSELIRQVAGGDLVGISFDGMLTRCRRDRDDSKAYLRHHKPAGD